MRTLNKITPVVIPFLLPWDWSADYQRQTCLALASKGLTVYAYMQLEAKFYFKNIRKKTKYPKMSNIVFYEPIYVIPFRRFKIIEQINQYVSFLFFKIFILKQRHSYVWIFDPTCYTIFKKIKNAEIIYDCVDYHRGVEMTKFSQKIEKEENQLIQEANYFFVNSRTLYKLHSKIRIADAVVPQGFDLFNFKKNESQVGKKLIHSRVKIGYVGAINHRLDFSLLENLIKRHQEWDFIIWGKVQEIEKNDLIATNKKINIISNYSNVTLGFSLERKDLFNVINKFDIGIIPYRNTSFNKYCFPMKIFEYFYAGIPVISSAIEELYFYPDYISIANDIKSWESEINKLLITPFPYVFKIKQKNISKNNSWGKKVDKILKYINL